MTDMPIRVLRKLSGPVASQFARPHGAGARVIAPFLNIVNRGVNQAAQVALRVVPGERILDLGFGGGVGLRLTLAALGDGRLTGVDLSPEVVRRAQKMFRAEIAAGRLEVLEGSVAALPVPGETVDGAYTVNTIYFWPDLDAGLAELHRVLVSGGRLVVATNSAARPLACLFFTQAAPAERANVLRRNGRNPTAIAYDPDDVAGRLAQIGYRDVEVTRPRRAVAIVVARKR